MAVLHRLLNRQLNKFNLSDTKLPENGDSWKLFLESVNATYQDQDQDRYLNERSLQISSKEMSELNQRLENAQAIAKLGYWYYNAKDDKALWSKEIYTLFEYDPLDVPPKYDEFMKRVHPDDIKKLDSAVKEAVEKGKSYEIEIRLLYPNKKIRWFRCIGHPHLPKDPTQKIEILSGVVLDVTLRKEHEAEIVILNEQLLDTARRAGMSEVATAILHNIGNVLNSINVAIEIAEENINQQEFKNIHEAVELVETHLSDATEYLNSDKKGKLILKYLKIFLTEAHSTKKRVEKELHALVEYIKHLRDIIATQQAFTGVSGIMDRILIENAIDAALQISGNSMTQKNIAIEKYCEDNISITTDKSKLYQILVNLIQNAKDAIVGSNRNPKKIIIRAQKNTEDSVLISVEDNGIGIQEENLIKIFQFGYTSKKHGHGIGLHSCAIAAKEMGGSLIAKSDGINKGAAFILSLPINPPTKRQGVSNG